MNDGALAGRTAIVTGAGDGIGRGVARRFAAEGARVLVAELNTETGARTAEELVREFGAEARFVPTDVTDKAQVHAMVDLAVATWGSVDVLVNNAWGAGSVSRVETKTDAQLQRGFAMGYYGPLWAMQAAFPHMKANGWGRVVNMCSLNGVNAHMGTLEYNSAKEALRTLTRTAAREWAPTGVVVNAVCPGAKSAAFHRMAAEHPEIEAAADRANPMGRLGDPETDIAPVVVFLAGEGARYLTGNTLFVDGGSHINGVAWIPDLDGEQ
ncbi:glucose 1-dehydrogenase [Actinocorallia sp. B10E7]|uniref:SDR family NAD(P)-dependent oxidoreductase n=1 Tax=Actinocorallia sp. B10E7 TaxID=3153558 RepID=UPI00325D22C0